MVLSLLNKGSPFTVKISGEGRVKESITRTRRAPSVATIGSLCDLNLKIPGEFRPSTTVLLQVPLPLFLHSLEMHIINLKSSKHSVQSILKHVP